MMGNRLLLILKVWRTAEGAPKDEEFNDGGADGGARWFTNP